MAALTKAVFHRICLTTRWLRAMQGVLGRGHDCTRPELGAARVKIKMKLAGLGTLVTTVVSIHPIS
jgi:hypothetical protein